MPTSQPKVASALARFVEESGLHYVTYSQPGISRIRSGTGFRYVDPEGHTIREPDVLARIQALAIPPAWTEVWICTLANGHLQAVGRDARGRRQYRYHPRWREVRDAAKFDELLNVARTLPVLRRRVEEDLLLPLLPREKVLAAVVWLLETTLIRVGNEEYARDNQSFGLTTLEDRHTLVEGLQVRFEFRGKSGKQHVVGIQDGRLAGIVKQCQDLPGQDLFQYVDLDGRRHDIASDHVNAYLHAIGGPALTAKAFRTWMGTVAAIVFLRREGAPRNVTEGTRVIVRGMQEISTLLRNTPAICRKSYVHPGVLQQYLTGELEEMCRTRTGEEPEGLRDDELATFAFLHAFTCGNARSGSRRPGHPCEQAGSRDG